MNLFSKPFLVLSVAAGQFGNILTHDYEQSSSLIHSNAIQNRTNFGQLAFRNLRRKREDEVPVLSEEVIVLSEEIERELKDLDLKTVNEVRAAAKPIVRAKIKAEKENKKAEKENKILIKEIGDLKKDLVRVQEKCEIYELLLGVRRELEETEDEFWEQLHFPNSDDRIWKWIMSLLLLNTPEARMWRELLTKNKMSIEAFARYVASLHDSFSKRDHRRVLIPRKCVSIKVLNELLKDGDLDCLTVEQRIVVTMAVEMRGKREDRLNWKTDESTTETNKIAGSDNLRCVLLEQVEIGDPKGATLPPAKNPRDERGGTSTTQKKPVTSFPRNLPYQNIRNVFFPSKIAQKSTEFMCELEDSYNAKKPTGTILVRFATVEIAAAAILARQTPKTVELKMVKCDEHQAKCSQNKVHIADFKNVQPTTGTLVSNKKNDHASTK